VNNPEITVSAEAAEFLKGEGAEALGLRFVPLPNGRFSMELPRPCDHRHANPERRVMRLAEVVLFPDQEAYQRRQSINALAKITKWGQFQPWAATEITLSVRGPNEQGKQTYAILNGQHTYLAALHSDVTELPVAIHTDLSLQCEAYLFTLKNSAIALAASQLAKALRAWGEPVIWQISGILAEYGLSLNTTGRGSKNPFSKQVGAVTGLRSVIDTNGPDGLATVVRWLVTGFEADDDTSRFNSYVIRGMGNFYSRYVRQRRRGKDVSLVDDIRFVRQIHGRYASIGKLARRYMNSMGGDLAAGYASALVHTYNEGLPAKSKTRLPSYSKINDLACTDAVAVLDATG